MISIDSRVLRELEPIEHLVVTAENPEAHNSAEHKDVINP